MFAVYCVVVNTAIAASPSEQMTQTQVQNFVSAEKSLSISSLADSVKHGSTLPNWAPYGQLFMVGNCSGLYLASGIDETNVPGLLIDHYTWIPVEQDPAFTHGIWVTFNHPAKDFTKPVTLMTYGASQSRSRASRAGLLQGQPRALRNVDRLAVHRLGRASPSRCSTSPSSCR